tara:strand:- start:2148 stop:2498 length:351 start_codon:yes stop_codon:yes gene_type:complete
MTKKSKKSKKSKKLKKAGNILYHKDTKRGTIKELSTRPESNSNKKNKFFRKIFRYLTRKKKQPDISPRVVIMPYTNDNSKNSNTPSPQEIQRKKYASILSPDTVGVSTTRGFLYKK